MRLNAWELLAMNNPLRRWAMGSIELARFQKLLQSTGMDLKGQRILDLACGSGHSNLLLRRWLEPSLLVGFDLMAEQISLAQSRQARSQAKLVQASILEMPWADQCFDGLVGFGILHHVTAWPQAVAEIHRVTRPGGLVLLEEPEARATDFFRQVVRFPIPLQGSFSFRELEGELVQRGFKILGRRSILLPCFRAYCLQRL